MSIRCQIVRLGVPPKKNLAASTRNPLRTASVPASIRNSRLSVRHRPENEEIRPRVIVKCVPHEIRREQPAARITTTDLNHSRPQIRRDVAPEFGRTLLQRITQTRSPPPLSMHKVCRTEFGHLSHNSRYSPAESGGRLLTMISR